MLAQIWILVWPKTIQFNRSFELIFRYSKCPVSSKFYTRFLFQLQMERVHPRRPYRRIDSRHHARATGNGLCEFGRCSTGLRHVLVVLCIHNLYVLRNRYAYFHRWVLNLIWGSFSTKGRFTVCRCVRCRIVDGRSVQDSTATGFWWYLSEFHVSVCGCGTNGVD